MLEQVSQYSCFWKIEKLKVSESFGNIGNTSETCLPLNKIPRKAFPKLLSHYGPGIHFCTFTLMAFH